MSQELYISCCSSRHHPQVLAALPGAWGAHCDPVDQWLQRTHQAAAVHLPSLTEPGLACLQGECMAPMAQVCRTVDSTTFTGSGSCITSNDACRHWCESTLDQKMKHLLLAPRHYWILRWLIVSWIFTNKVKWNFNQNTNILIWENALQSGCHFMQASMC